jgi:hypothetical protein
MEQKLDGVGVSGNMHNSKCRTKLTVYATMQLALPPPPWSPSTVSTSTSSMPESAGPKKILMIKSICDVGMREFGNE